MRAAISRRLLSAAVKYVPLSILAFCVLLPILVTFLTAIRSNGDILKNGLWSPPRPLFLGGFAGVWTTGKLGLYIRNSFIITLPSVLGSLFCSSLASYAISRFQFRMKNIVFLLFFAGLWFPPQTFLIPIYFLAQKLRVYNTFQGMILVHVAYALPFAVLVLSRFFAAIPSSIIEAARIDGAREAFILARIVVPLAIPAFASVAIFQFTWVWNDFFWGLVMTQSPGVQPVMIGMTSTLGRYVFDWNGQSVGAVLAMIPPLLIFVFLQRFFIEGVRMGAGK
jgi:multiple sugar transport system permease protein